MKPITLPVLYILSDGEFHSVASLAQSLCVEPDCIVKALQDAESIDISYQNEEVYAYRWQNPIKWIDKKEILSFFTNNSCRFSFTVLSEVDSTNRFLLDSFFSCDSLTHFNPVIIAELQTQGRGRFQRLWYSGLGDSLTFSVLWRFDRTINELSGLSLAVGVAIVRALGKIGIGGIALKWPNDVMFSFRKLSGILIEHCNKLVMGCSVVIGIGLNVQLSSLTKKNINQAFVDLYEITGQSINRNQLLAVVLSELAVVLDDFNQFGFSYFRDEWINYHAYEGKLISITPPDGSVSHGKVDGIDYDGSIRLKMATGIKRSFNSGELMLY